MEGSSLAYLRSMNATLARNAAISDSVALSNVTDLGTSKRILRVAKRQSYVRRESQQIIVDAGVQKVDLLVKFADVVSWHLQDLWVRSQVQQVNI